MGFSIAIMACAAQDRDALLAAAGLTDTGRADAHNETMLSGASDGTTYFLWRNWRMTKGTAEPLYEEMAKTVPFYVLDVNETVMFAATRRYGTGKLLWSVSGGDESFDVEGNVPADLEAIKSAMVTRYMSDFPEAEPAEAEEDHFGLAAEVFAYLTGFYYDGAYELAFTALEGEMPRQKPGWKFW